MYKYTLLLFIFISTQLFSQSGLLRSYYSRGKIRSEISKADDIYNGTSFWFYENGNLSKELTYDNGILEGWVRYYYKSGLLKEEYLVKGGVRDGVYRGYYKNGALRKVANYSLGELVSESILENDPNYVPAVDEYVGSYKQYEIRRRKELYLCNIDLCPEPIGGMGAIYSRLDYPAHARLYGLEGEILLVATVDIEGNVTNVVIAKGLGLGCDEAAQEAVTKTRFKPGKDKDKKVVADVTLKIRFDLANLEQYGSMNPIDIVENDEHNKDKSDTQANKTEQLLTNFQCDIDVCPKPQGGLKAILEHLHIPAVAYRKKLWGEVIILATVDKYGLVRDTKVLKDLGYGLGLAAEVAVLETKFEPGLDKGEKVMADVKVIVPFSADHQNTE